MANRKKEYSLNHILPEREKDSYESFYKSIKSDKINGEDNAKESYNNKKMNCRCNKSK